MWANRPEDFNPGKVMTEKMLVLRLSALGGVAMTLPAVYSLAHTYPRLKVVFVTENRFLDLIIDAPPNLRVIGVDRNAMRKPGGSLRFLRRLRKEKADAVVDLHNVFRTWTADAYLRFIGKRVVVVDKMRLKRRKIKRGEACMKQSFVEEYFEIFKMLGYPSDPSVFRGFAFERAHRDDGVLRIGIAPFSQYETKMLPAATVDKVLELLSSREESVKVSLFGGGERELRQFEAWREKYPCLVEYVSGRCGLREELEIMSGLDVMLAMDSANMHLASLVGTRVVSVWGATTPSCGFMGWEQSSADAIVAGLDCQPCAITGSRGCKLGTMACMKSVTADEIVAKLVRK